MRPGRSFVGIQRQARLGAPVQVPGRAGAGPAFPLSQRLQGSASDMCKRHAYGGSLLCWLSCRCWWAVVAGPEAASSGQTLFRRMIMPMLQGCSLMVVARNEENVLTVVSTA